MTTEQQPFDLRSLGESLVNEVAEPFRFTFEVAWEVANKGEVSFPLLRTLLSCERMCTLYSLHAGMLLSARL